MDSAMRSPTKQEIATTAMRKEVGWLALKFNVKVVFSWLFVGFREVSKLLSIFEVREMRNARCRVRTCDFLRVKQALYH
jgi:hypothetical protein